LNAAVGAYVVPVKPIDPLLDAIRERESIKSSTVSHIQVIGGGAAAVEIALALAYRWRAASVERKIGLVSAEPILRVFPPKVRKSALAALAAMKVSVVESQPVAAIEPTHLTLGNGSHIPAQISMLATGYAPAPLIASIDVAKADDGSISINSGLQSRSHKNVFAVGDCATNPKLALPKSGVFAVRQGPLLFENLERAVRGKEIASFEFKQEALALISLGGKRAIAARNGLTATGGWVWRWKDRIDRQWVEKYT
jgi:selenide, water dikinase